MPMALAQNFEGGLTDIEMANGLNVYDFDDTFEDERAFEMEYEVSLILDYELFIYLDGNCHNFLKVRLSAKSLHSRARFSIF